MPIRTVPMLALFLPGLVAAQDFRLEDYDPAPFHRHYLSLAPAFSWVYMGNRQDRDTVLEESGSGYGTPALGIAYGTRAWNLSREWNLSANLQLSGTGEGARSHSETESYFPGGISSESRRSSVAGSLQADGAASYRKYLWGSWFIEPSGDGMATYFPGGPSHSRSWARNFVPIADSVDFEYSSSRSRRRSQNENATIRFAVGFGRILDVDFASTGMFMLERLAASGAPGAHLDARGMRDLQAYMEGRRKLRPFLDGRRAAIFDMASVAGFLEERGVAPIPAQALLAMADEWANPSAIPRRSGWELRFDPYFRGYWSDSRDRDEQRNWSGIRPEHEDDEVSIAAVTDGPVTRSSGYRSRSYQGEREYGMAAHWVFQRPWRRRFQFGLGADGRYSDTWRELGTSSGYSPSASTGPEDAVNLKQYFSAVQGDATASATWIPESRSWVAATWTGHTGWIGNHAPVPEGFYQDGSAVDASLRAGLTTGYEVAPRLVFQGSVFWDGYWSDGYRREPDYATHGYRFLHEVRMDGSWRSDLRLRYYLF